MSTSRCWITTPCGTWNGHDVYVGYVWAVDLTQAKRLAIQTEPNGDGDFTSFRFRRRTDLDDLCPAGWAAWDANELPPEHRHRAADLWNLSTDL